MNVKDIAQVCHEANRIYCLSHGDDSQPTWEDAPAWQKKSVIDGVEYHVNHPKANPQDSHNNWLKLKQSEGWKWGPVKDAEKKEHPCFLPYNELPPAQQFKDYLFIAIVRALVGHIDE